VTYPLLIELRDHHLAEAAALQCVVDPVGVSQAGWHVEVASQLTAFADALAVAFPSLKTRVKAPANQPGDDAINA
jgi:hypothetical protein